MPIGDRLRQFARAGEQFMSGGTPSEASSLDIMSANAPSVPASGVWGILANFAKTRGMTRLQRLAMSKEEEERQLKLDEVRQRIADAPIDRQYKQALMNQMSEQTARAGRQEQRDVDLGEAEASQKAFAFQETQPSRVSQPREEISPVLGPGRLPSEAPRTTTMPIQTDLPNAMEVKFGGGRSIVARPRSRQDVESDRLRSVRETSRAQKAGDIFSAPATSDVFQDGRLIRPATPPERNTQVLEIADPRNPSKAVPAKIIEGQVYTFDGTLVPRPQAPPPKPGQAIPGQEIPVYDQVTGALTGSLNLESMNFRPAPPQAAGGGRAIPGSEVLRMAGFRPLFKFVQDIADASAEVHQPALPIVGGAASRLGGAARNLANTYLGSEKAISDLKSFALRLPEMARQLGDVGNIGEREAERILTGLPLDATFTEEESRRLLQTVWQFLVDKEAELYKTRGRAAPAHPPLVFGDVGRRELK